MRRPLIIGAGAAGVIVLCCVGFLVLGVIGGSRTPTAINVAPTSSSGLSTTPAPDGGPSPAEAATLTAVVMQLQGTAVPVATQRAAQTTSTVRVGPTVTPVPAIGQPIRAPNWQFIVQSSQRAREYAWSDFGNKDTAVGEFVIVLLQVANVGNQNFGLNTFDFELYDSQNRKYNQASNANGFGEWLKRQGRQPMCSQCPPGTAINTGVIFDVAPGLTGLRMRLVQAKADVSLP